MIKAKHNIVIYNFFKLYAYYQTLKHFKPSIFYNTTISQRRSVLVVSNHISWWDGFWAMYLNLKYFKKKFHFMMLEENLKKYWFFNYSGGYSVKKNSKDTVASLTYTKELLKDPKNMVLLFPQGNIKSVYETNIEFQKGVKRIIKEQNDFQIFMLVNLIDYYSQKKPSLNMNLKEYNHKSDIETEYNDFYKECIEKQKKTPINAE